MKTGCIYALVCPRTNYIFYIGQTIRNINSRLNEHIETSLTTLYPTAKEEFIMDLHHNYNVKPKIQLLEETTPNILNDREKYWKPI